MDAARFASQDDSHLPLRWIRWAAATDLFEVWEKAFAVSFFAYRARLQELGLQSCHNVRGARVTIGLEDAESWLEHPEDEILVPVDDDDYFRSDLDDIARRFDEGTNLVIWPLLSTGFIGEGRRRTCHRFRWPTLGTNNFAIRKSFLTSAFTPSEIVRMLAHHYNASRKIAIRFGTLDPASKAHSSSIVVQHPTVRVIRRAYGMYNVHPGSIFYLNHVFRKPDPAGWLRGLDLEAPVRLPRYAKAFEVDVRKKEAEERALRRAEPPPRSCGSSR